MRCAGAFSDGPQRSHWTSTGSHHPEMALSSPNPRQPQWLTTAKLPRYQSLGTYQWLEKVRLMRVSRPAYDATTCAVLASFSCA